MPANHTHFRFGSELLPLMPPDVRRTVGRFRQLYDMGLHGPDILMYHVPALRSGTTKLSTKFHAQTGKVFFERCCRTVRMNWSEGAMAYLYGVLAHYVLDSTCHPFIRRMVDAGKGSHNQIETEFDRYLLELDGKLPAHLYDQSAHMQLTPGECQTVALFYPNVSPSAVSRCVKTMRGVTRSLTMQEGPRRQVVSSAIRLVRPNVADLIVPVQPDPKCKELDESLMRLYEMAQQRYLPLLEQLQDHLRRKSPLSTDFSLTFE